MFPMFWIETIAYGVCFLVMLFFNVEKHSSEDKFIIEERKLKKSEKVDK